MWVAAKAMVRRKHVALDVYIRKVYSPRNQKNLKVKPKRKKKEGNKEQKLMEQKTNIQSSLKRLIKLIKCLNRTDQAKKQSRHKLQM